MNVSESRPRRTDPRVPLPLPDSRARLVGVVRCGGVGTALRLRMLIVAATVSCAPVAAGTRPAAAAPLVFDGATVVDVAQGRLLPAQRVVVVGTRIRAVGSIRSVRMPPGAQIIDARGKYLIPGLWDMHVHPRRMAHLFYPLLIAHGVTGIRDAGSEVPLDTLTKWKQQIAAGTRVGPRLIVVGPALDERRPCTRTPEIHICVATVADARQVVDSLQKAGVDMIKTYDLSERMYFAVVGAARRVGLPVGGHIHARQVTALEASDSGAAILDHLNTSGGLDTLCWGDAATIERCQPLAERFRRQGTWFTPTLMRFAVEQGRGMTSRSQALYARFTAAVGEFWSESVPTSGAFIDTGAAGAAARVEVAPAASATSMGAMYVMRRVDLPILAGTDAGAPVMLRLPPGLSLHTELAMYVADGLTPLAALQAATLNPAKFLHGTDSLGTIGSGKLADLVLLDANPLADITNTMRIRAVVANGRYFDRAALDRLLTAAKAEVLGTNNSLHPEVP